MSTTTHNTSPSRIDLAERAEPLSTPKVIAASVAAATLANAVIWAIGAAAGGSFEYTDGGATQSAAPGGVLALTAVPLAVGMAVTALLSLRWVGIVRVAQVVGSVLAIGTIYGTLDADFDGASTVALSLAHLAIVPALVIGLELVRRRSLARAAGA